MDEKIVATRNTTKTDLSLLLESLKFQMNCPSLQKQALLTIHSICEKQEANVHLLKELGGVDFVYNLSKSGIIHSEVREAAIFTLGTIAEANVYCKNYLCKKEIFTELSALLTEEGTPLTLKRVSVYLLFALIANNKLGQTLALSTSCLDIVLYLFRTTFPLVKGLDLKAASQTFELWSSLSSFLCSCVNNPQNEEAQRICVAVFPTVKTWLQQISLPCAEIFQPICSFISMTVANNSRAQECFFASGAMETLTLILIRLSSAAETSVLSCQLSVILTKALSACITENPNLAANLSQYGMVAHLFTLLMSSHLGSDDRLPILLSIGHCTESSNEHQSQLVQCGALPLIITLLTEDTNEEVRKAATYILQTCKKATMSLGIPEDVLQQDAIEPLSEFDSFRKSAQNVLKKIDMLEKKQLEEAEEESVYSANIESNSTNDRANVFKFSALPPPESKTDNPTICMQSNAQQGNNSVVNAEKENTSKVTKMSYCFNPWEEETQSFQSSAMCSGRAGKDSMPSPVQSLERDSESLSVNKQMVQYPLPVRRTKPNEIKLKHGLRDHENRRMKNKMLDGESASYFRCTGCVLSFEEVTSRTFDSLQSSCQSLCDMHKVLQEATNQFRMLYLNEMKRLANTEMNRSSVSSRGSCRNFEKSDTPLPKLLWRKPDDVALTPIRKKAVLPNGISLTPLKRLNSVEVGNSASKLERRGNDDRGHDAGSRGSTAHGSNRRKRQDFCSDEIQYLLSGVQKFGFSWNSILWSYPFHPCRTNVDLAKKYRRLMSREKSS